MRQIYINSNEETRTAGRLWRLLVLSAVVVMVLSGATMGQISLMSPDSLHAATIDTLYIDTIVLNRGSNPNPIVWSITDTTPAPWPDWLSTSEDTSRSGSRRAFLILSGTPDALDTVALEVNALADSPIPVQDRSVTETYTVAVNPWPDISRDTLNQWTVGRSGYVDTIKVAGGSPKLNIRCTGGSPLGNLSINDRTGEVTGTAPNSAGNLNIIVTCTDINGASDVDTVNIVINAHLQVSPTVLNDWSVGGDAYRHKITRTAGTGTPTFDWFFQNAPAWLTMTEYPDSVVLGGSPLIGGYFQNVKIGVSDAAADTGWVTDDIRVYPKPNIKTESLPPWTRNFPGYKVKLQLDDIAFPTVTWGPGNLTDTLPTSLILAGDSISGRPWYAGTFQVAVAVRDGANSRDTELYALVINDTLTIETECPLPVQTAGSRNVISLSAKGGTGYRHWRVLSGNLPPGAMLDTAYGLILGNPTFNGPSGPYSFQLEVHDSIGAASLPVDCSITIRDALDITSGGTLPTAVVHPPDSQYSYTFLANGGTGNLTWTTRATDSTRLQSRGLQLWHDGRLLGTPNAADSFAIQVTVTDDGGGLDSAWFSLKLDKAPLFANEVVIIEICEGDEPPTVIATDDNHDPITYSLVYGALPSGVQLNPSGGFIGVAGYGTAGIYNVKLEARETIQRYLTDTVLLAITVGNTNRVPQITDSLACWTQTVQEGSAAGALCATDPDGDRIEFDSASGSLPSGLHLSHDGTWIGTIAYGQARPAPYDLRVSVCDTCTITACSPSRCISGIRHFTLYVKPDTIPPRPCSDPIVVSPRTVRICVTDDGAGVGAGSVLLRWWYGNALPGDPGNLVEMDSVSSAGREVTYQYHFADTSMESCGVEGQFLMFDKKDPSNDTTTPRDTLPVTFGNAQFTKTVPQWLGAADSLWHLVSFPGVYDANNRRVKKILTELSGLGYNTGNDDGDTWRLYAYRDGGFENMIAARDNDSIVPGEGYWFRHIMRSFTLRMPEGEPAPTLEPFSIDLDSGWNLIGNPFFFPVGVDMTGLATHGSVSSLIGAGAATPGEARASWTRHLFSAGVTLSQLEPWKGYAINCETSGGCTIKLEPHHARPTDASPARPEGYWETTILVQSSNVVREILSIGHGGVASDGPDLNDIRPVAFMGLGAPVAACVGKYGEFVRDIRGSSDLQTWELRIDTDLRNGSLSWDKAEIAEGKALVLRDVVMSQTIDMTRQQYYGISSSQQLPPGRFVVYYGEQSEVDEASSAPAETLPVKYALYQNYPNPFNPSTTFSFDLPRPTQVKFEVFNVLGQRVTTLVDQMMPSGSHTVVWDGVSDGGSAVASGVYFARLNAGSFQKSVSMVLVK